MEFELHRQHDHEAHRRHKLLKFIVRTALQAATLATAICAVNELSKIRRHVHEIERRRK
ncbi:MAG: hypothetical protein K2L77_08510 [Muribaculaceae bacterium]|nr:hypothetical protein [Muribaculaceae bacterium]